MALLDLLTSFQARENAGITFTSKDVDKTFSTQVGFQFTNRVSFNDNDNYSEPIFRFGNNNEQDNIVDTTFRGGLKTNLDRRALDTERIEAFYFSPQGAQFILRQTGLQLMNPKINAPMGSLFDSSPANQRTYVLGTNTLAQIAASGVSNIKREGVIGASLVRKEGYIGDESFLENNDNNRLIYLQQKFIQNVPPNANVQTGFGSNTLNALSNIGNTINNFLNKLGGKGEELYSYVGGPKSAFGVGRTFAGRYTNTNPNNFHTDYSGHQPETPTDFYLNFQGTNHEIDGDKDNYRNQGKRPGTWIGFNNSLRNSAFNQEDGFLSAASSTENDIREYKYNLGSPGVRPNDTSTHTRKVTDGTDGNKAEAGNGLLNYNSTLKESFRAVDKINYVDIIQSTSTGGIPKGLEPYVKDMCNFRIECLNPRFNFDKGKIIAFRAFIDSFSDKYSNSHNEIKYSGRAEAFLTYGRFIRDVDISFKIAAQTRHEMKPLYRKVNFLAAQTAPIYNFGRINTPLQQITIGDYLYRVPGVITSVSISWQKDYPWEIKNDSELDSQMLILPQVLDVSFSFKIIHDFLPQATINSPFIGIGDSDSYKRDVNWLEKGATTYLDQNPEVEFPNDVDIAAEERNNYIQGFDTFRNSNQTLASSRYAGDVTEGDTRESPY